MKEELYNKIDKFCNETDWSKYPTYEHALEDFIKEIVAEETKELEKENAELRHQLNKNPCVCNTEWHCNDCLEQLTKAKELLTRFVIASVYFNGKETNLVEEAEQFLKKNKNE